MNDRFGRTGGEASFNTYDFETLYRFNPHKTLNLNIGANFRHIIASWNMLSTRTTENRLGLYAQGDWKVLPSLEVSAGLRYDLDTFDTPTLSPRGAMIYHVTPNHALRISGSVAYRPPTTFDVGQHIVNVLMLPRSSPIRVNTLGTRNLKPEEIISYEAGYQGWWWQHRLRTRLTGFYNHISDLIDVRNLTSNPLHQAFPINGGAVDVYGGEAGVEVLVTSWLSGFASYAYQELRQTSDVFSRRGFPRHKVNAGLRATWHPFTGELLYHRVGMASYPLTELFANLSPFFPTGTVLPQEQVPAYNLLNLRLRYVLWRHQAGGYTREAEIAISVFNALNDSHREHPLGNLLGTRVMGWLTVKL